VPNDLAMLARPAADPPKVAKTIPKRAAVP
jgi:hypothetical protein